MSDLGWTRLAALADVGYCIERNRSTQRFLYLRHIDGRAPNIGLWSNGDIEPLGNPIWPEHLPFDHSISARQGARFQQFCALQNHPTFRQECRHHIRKLLELSVAACWLIRAAGVIYRHLTESRR